MIIQQMPVHIHRIIISTSSICAYGKNGFVYFFCRTASSVWTVVVSGIAIIIIYHIIERKYTGYIELVGLLMIKL